MSAYSLVKIPNPILYKKCKPLKHFDLEFVSAVQMMKDVLRDSPAGVGISAPQIGYNKRIFRVRIPEHRNQTLVGNIDDAWEETIINPEILERDGELVYAIEECLSLPGVKIRVPRYPQITVRYQDIVQRWNSFILTDFHARVFQHELDHLDGKLITDYVEMPSNELGS